MKQKYRKERGGQKTERLRVIDWEHPANNDFLLISQFSVTGAVYTSRLISSFSPWFA